MKSFTIYQDGDHRWVAFGQDPDKPEEIIDTNQFVVTSSDTGCLLDPGGAELFPDMVAALSREISVDTIQHLFLTHQDPDVSSAITLWDEVCADGMKIYISWMWKGFVKHFDNAARFVDVPDEGMDLNLGGGVTLRAMPAHYLHSPGNFSVYDPKAKILFTGDIGAALVPESEQGDIFVQNFDHHIQFMEPFHKRWMVSARARDAWVAMVRNLDVNILAPQHGLLFKGDDVQRFLDWFGNLEVGNGLSAYQQYT